MTTLPLSGSEIETDTEQCRRVNFARVYCVRRRARSPSPSPEPPQCERVRRLVRRKQPKKQRIAGSAVQQSVGASSEIAAMVDNELMAVFEFQPGAPVASTVDFFYGDYGNSDTDGGDDDSDCCTAVLGQRKWWLQDRVRDKLVKAQRKVHHSLDMGSMPPLDMC